MEIIECLADLIPPQFLNNAGDVSILIYEVYYA